MKYYVTVNKKYRYVKVYKIVKKLNETENALSKAVSRMVDKYLLKRNTGEQQEL